ncbi:MAG: DUF362 domain-containing protein [Rikenellaceae bacterium]|nr:DUF362 domain-containing protein [Rikenellaceae bacterium]
MKRREFLRSLALLTGATVVDLGGVGSALAQTAPRGSAAKGTDLVAVMGGEPVVMLDRMLTEMGGIGKFVKKGDKVVVKPNIGWDRKPELAGDTNPELVGALVTRCLAAGASQVEVFDHTCHEWTKCYANSGIKAAVEKAGGKMVPGNDESYYQTVALPRGVKLKEAKIHKSLIDCDVWFNIPILKHHGGAKMSVSLKNYMGIVWNRQVFHSTDLQQCIADVATWSKKPALNIVDGYRALLKNGPQGKSIDDVKVTKALFASADPVAVDTASILFFNQATPMPLDNVSHLENAQKLRVGTMDIESLSVKRIRM